jgi:hypothetical protein
MNVCPAISSPAEASITSVPEGTQRRFVAPEAQSTAQAPRFFLRHGPRRKRQGFEQETGAVKGILQAGFALGHAEPGEIEALTAREAALEEARHGLFSHQRLPLRTQTAYERPEHGRRHALLEPLAQDPPGPHGHLAHPGQELIRAAARALARAQRVERHAVEHVIVARREAAQLAVRERPARQELERLAITRVAAQIARVRQHLERALELLREHIEPLERALLPAALFPRLGLVLGGRPERAQPSPDLLQTRHDFRGEILPAGGSQVGF